MKKVIFAINTTLDGVVDHMKIAPPIKRRGSISSASRGMLTHSSTGVKRIN